MEEKYSKRASVVISPDKIQGMRKDTGSESRQVRVDTVAGRWRDER